MSVGWGSLLVANQYNSKQRIESWSPSDAATPRPVNTGRKMNSLPLMSMDERYGPPLLKDKCRHTVFVKPLPPVWSRTKGFRVKKNSEQLRPTIESNGGLDKRQVALKKVQRLHESPSRFPDQIDLHVERKDVVPNIYCRGNHCGKN